MKVTTQRIALAAACLAAMLAPRPARAGILIAHAPNFSGADYPSDFVGGQQILDQFVPASGSAVGTVRWWGIYRDHNLHADDFTIRFYNGFIPATTPDYSAPAANVTRTATGRVNLNGYQVYEYTANLSTPWSLTAGTTQGISIINNVGGSGTGWSWQTSAASDFGNNYYRSQEGDPWSNAGGHMAFELSDDPAAVPEPATLSSGVLAGLIGLGALYRHRKPSATA